jgi:eukaryotic-like serine/threonine-protein kinase
MSKKPTADAGDADGVPGGAERVSTPMDQGTAVLTPPPAPLSDHLDATLPRTPGPRTGAITAPHVPEQIGRYQIIERVGQGGMGVLYRGIDPVLDREVAIKVMIGDFGDDLDQLRPRFQREARAIARLQHRNIVTVFEFAEDNGTPYIVMEFLRGASLSARAKAEPPLSIDEKVDIVAQLCTGLGYAHEQGIVHRDVKPANILLLEDGSVKLLDFGIAKLTSSTLTRQGDVLGSPSYMSPEQIMGLETVDGRSDVFSAGAVLFELLAGRRPFDGDTTPTIVMKILNTEAPSLDALDSAIPAPLAAIVARALHKDPAQRFQTATEFARELRSLRRTVPSDVTVPLTGPIGPDTLAGRGPIAPADAAPAAPATKVRTWMLAAGIAGAVVAAAIVVATGVGRSSTRTGAASAAAAAQGSAAQRLSTSDRTPAATATAAAARGEAPATVPVAPKEPAVKQAAAVPPAPDASSRAASPKGRASRTPAADPSKPSPPAPGKETTARAAAAPASSAVPIAVTASGAYPFAIVDGGRVLSAASTSHELNLAAGRKVRLVAPEYSLDQMVTIEDDGERHASIQAPALGKLTIRSNQETCTVQIGERVLGYPPVNNISLAAGAHQIDVVCPNGRIKSEFVNIVGGQSQRVIVQ